MGLPRPAAQLRQILLGSIFKAINGQFISIIERQHKPFDNANELAIIILTPLAGAFAAVIFWRGRQRAKIAILAILDTF